MYICTYMYMYMYVGAWLSREGGEGTGGEGRGGEGRGGEGRGEGRDGGATCGAAGELSDGDRHLRDLLQELLFSPVARLSLTPRPLQCRTSLLAVQLLASYPGTPGPYN